jgi:hypothetical protein
VNVLSEDVLVLLTVPVDCTSKWYVVSTLSAVIVCEWLVICAALRVVLWLYEEVVP